MSRKAPNIDIGNVLKKRDRLSYKEFVKKVITDTYIYEYEVDILEVDENGVFTLTLLNKRFHIDILQVDNIEDYIDVYLFGVRQSHNRYSVNQVGNDIIIQFNQKVTRLPNEVDASNFKVRGKIVEING
jgi:hypothetical protein